MQPTGDREWVLWLSPHVLLLVLSEESAAIGGGSYLRLIADEINLLVNTHIWATFHNHAPSLKGDRLPGGGPSLAWGDICRVIVVTWESAGLHNFRMRIAYFLSAELLRFARQLGYDIVALETPSVV